MNQPKPHGSDEFNHDARIAGTGKPGHSTNQKIALLILLGLALGAIFLLPNFVSEPWIKAESDAGRATPSASPSAVSPSTAAELRGYRQESQTVLAGIIATRDRLAGQGVETWAEIEFRQALRKIAGGDEQYSYGDYQASLQTYRQILQELEALEALGQEKLAGALGSGLAAVESLNVGAAGQALQLASVIAPEDPEVLALAGRVEILPLLAGHVETGDRARADGRLATARDAYRAAARVDPLHRRAAEALTAVERELVDSTFRRHMSRGYAALDNGDYDGAMAAFDQADKVYPGHTAVRQALAQVSNRQSRSLVNQKMAQAVELEAREEWQQALDIYEDLLAQDPTLTEVKVRLIPARVRADLDRRFEAVFDDPLKLADPAFYRRANTTLNDARGIPGPGEKLRRQIDRLDVLVRAAVSSVDVVFESDNLTDVTLFRVANLGRFDQTSLKLKPGRYVAAGTRKGFRDVRVEFIVTGEPLDGPIVVRCVEPI